MRGLARRIDDLEREVDESDKTVAFVNVEHGPDGGIIHNGQYYKDGSALIHALGIKSGMVQFIYWRM